MAEAAPTETATALDQPQLPVTSSPELSPPTLAAQIKRHGVALISLCVALISLSYNTWRNETTESHRNTRAAGFRILLELGELQQIVDYTAYFQTRDAEASGVTGVAQTPAAQQWVRGWGKVALIRDLGLLLPAANAAAGEALFAQWQAQAVALEQGIGASAGAQAETLLSAAIQQMRQETLATLQQLD